MNTVTDFPNYKPYVLLVSANTKKLCIFFLSLSNLKGKGVIAQMISVSSDFFQIIFLYIPLDLANSNYHSTIFSTNAP